MHTHALRTCPISYLSVTSDRLLYVRPSRRARHPNGMTASTCPEENKKRTHTHTAINLNKTNAVHSRGACVFTNQPHQDRSHHTEIAKCCFNMTERIFKNKTNKNVILFWNAKYQLEILDIIHPTQAEQFLCKTYTHSCKTVLFFFHKSPH